MICGKITCQRYILANVSKSTYTESTDPSLAMIYCNLPFHRLTISDSTHGSFCRLVFQVTSATDASNFDKYPRDLDVPPDENSGWDLDFQAIVLHPGGKVCVHFRHCNPNSSSWSLLLSVLCAQVHKKLKLIFYMHVIFTERCL